MTTRHDHRRLRHSGRHRSADRRLHLRPARAGAAAAVRRDCAALAVAGRLSRAECRRPRCDRPRLCRHAARGGADGRRPRLRRHADRCHQACATARSSRWCITRCAWRPASPRHARPSCALRRTPHSPSPSASSSPAATTAKTLIGEFAVRRTNHRSRARHRPAPRAPRIVRHAAAAGGRLGRAAQGLRHAGASAGARRNDRPLAADHRRRHRPQPRDDRRPDGPDRGTRRWARASA